MSVSTTKYAISIDRTKQQDHYPRWQTMLFWGVILALVVVAVVMPLYLAESQTIQAEASSTAFSLLAVGLAYLWWEHPAGKRGLCYAALTGITLVLSILCKLLGLTALVPIVLLMLARLWQTWRTQPGTGSATLRSIAVGIPASILTPPVLLPPFPPPPPPHSHN